MTSPPEIVDFESAIVDPAGAFAEPGDVIADQQLSQDQKMRVLRQWELDALRLSESEAEGMGGGEESRLHSVR